MRLVARTYLGLPCAFEIEAGRFTRIEYLPHERATDLPIIAPGLIDIQMNGFGGIDFNQPLESTSSWEHATKALYAQGCTGFLMALITNQPDGYRALLESLVPQLRAKADNCLGFHFEGPWLNPDPGYRGAHRAEWMTPPDWTLFEFWRAQAGDWLRLITLAPEMAPDLACDIIQRGSAQGVRFFLGHSAAMGEVLRRAVEAGAVGWTHLGNAMPAQVPKFENVLLHVLAEKRLKASLIPDGLHIPPDALRALIQALDVAPSRLLLTTDAMAAAAAENPLGRYSLGEIQVEMNPQDGSARLPGSGRLAGSTLTPLEAVRRACELGGLSFHQAWEALSVRPAALLGLSHGLLAGNRADFCLLESEKTMRLLSTYHRGECKYRAD